MRPNGKEVADDSITDSHDESPEHDWVLPPSLMRDAMTIHRQKEP